MNHNGIYGDLKWTSYYYDFQTAENHNSVI